MKLFLAFVACAVIGCGGPMGAEDGGGDVQATDASDTADANQDGALSMDEAQLVGSWTMTRPAADPSMTEVWTQRFAADHTNVVVVELHIGSCVGETVTVTRIWSATASTITVGRSMVGTQTSYNGACMTSALDSYASTIETEPPLGYSISGNTLTLTSTMWQLETGAYTKNP